MPIGKESVKRAVATKKPAKTEQKTLDTTIAEVFVGDISYKSGKACPTLVKSVKENGVILPVILVKDGDSLKVIDGVKRLNALKELGITVVKAVVLNGDAKKMKTELKKCGATSECTEKAVKKPETCVDVKEEKFALVKRLGEDDFPVYLL